MSIPRSHFEGNFSTYVVGKSFWYYRDPKIDFGASRYILCKKILNTFVCLDGRILVEKWNVYEGHILPRPLLQTFRLETTSLCLNTRVHAKKKNFQILIIFIEININVWLLCAHHVKRNVFLHTRRPNCQVVSLLRTWFLC